MPAPVKWPDCVRFPSLLAWGLSQVLHTEHHLSAQLEVSRKHCGTASDEICAFAPHPHLDLKSLLADARPAVTNPAHRHMDIPESIIMVIRVFVIEPAFQEEARRWHMAHDPFGVPFGICITVHCGRAKPEIGVFLVSFMQFGV